MLRKIHRHLVRENRIYIMPSAPGAIFLSVIVVMILTAATYNNNLIFILGFFLFAMFVVSMLQTHYNLKGVRLEFAGSEEGFEGERIVLLFRLTQSRAHLKRGLEVRTASSTFRTTSQGREDLRPDEHAHTVRIEVEAFKRGRHVLPDIILQTYFPLGLFRAWKVFRPSGEILVYPAATGERPPPLGEFAEGQDDAGLRTSPDGDFGELKGYRSGESYHQIAWKQFARSGELYSKVHWGAEHRHYDLHWQQPNVSELETYLRQMSRWVQMALEEGASFELETPDLKIEAGSGREQAVACWRALAQVKAVA